MDTLFGAGTQRFLGVAADTGYAQSIFTAPPASPSPTARSSGSATASAAPRRAIQPGGRAGHELRLGGRSPRSSRACCSAAAGGGGGRRRLRADRGTSTAVWHTNGATAVTDEAVLCAHHEWGAFDGGAGTSNFHIAVSGRHERSPVPADIPTYHGMSGCRASPPGRVRSSWFAAFDAHWYEAGLVARHPGSGIGVATVGPSAPRRPQDSSSAIACSRCWTPDGHRRPPLRPLGETVFPGTPAAPAKYTLFRITADGARTARRGDRRDRPDVPGTGPSRRQGRRVESSSGDPCDEPRPTRQLAASPSPRSAAVSRPPRRGSGAGGGGTSARP